MRIRRPWQRYGLTAFIAALGLAIAVQGYYLYRVHAELDAVRAGQRQAPEAPGSMPRETSVEWAMPDAAFDPANWDPFQELDRMQAHVDALFGQARSRFFESPRFSDLTVGQAFRPNLDVHEEDDRFVVTVDVPGADASTIDVTLEGQTLRIAGTKSHEARSGSGRQVRIERHTGRFERVISLPAPVKPDSLQTAYEDGVLTIMVEKDPNPKVIVTP